MDLLEAYNNSEDKLLHKDLTDIIISCFYQVYNDLGYGFLERVYQKASEELNPANEKQLINYLKATDIEVGMLLNFDKRPQFKRKVFTNSNK